MCSLAIPRALHNQEVLQATLRLRREVVPAFAATLNSEFEAAFGAAAEKAVPLYAETLCHRLHAAGINLRLLGLVRSHISNPVLKAVVLMEILARIFKCMLNNKLRRAVETHVGIAVERCRQIAASIISLSVHVGKEEKVTEFWTSKVKLIMSVKFPGALSEEESDPSVDLWDSIPSSSLDTDRFRRSLLSRFLSMTGIILASSARKFVKHHIKTTIVSSDVRLMIPRIKNMVIGDLALVFSKYMAGIRLLTQASRNLGTAHRLFQVVHDSLKRAPQCNSIFYEKILHSTIGQTFAALDSENDTDVIGTLSDILDTSITLSLSQRPGISKEEQTVAIAHEYVKAARLMRKAKALNHASWMTSRAKNLGVETAEVILEGYTMESAQYELGPITAIVEKFPNEPRAHFYWIRTLIRWFASVMPDDPDLVLPLERLHGAARALAFLAKHGPQYLRRKAFAFFLQYPTTAVPLISSLQWQFWENIPNGKNLRGTAISALAATLSSQSEFGLSRCEFDGSVLSDFISAAPARDGADSIRSVRFLWSGVPFSELENFLRRFSASLKAVSFKSYPHKIEDLNCLLKLEGLQTLSLQDCLVSTEVLKFLNSSGIVSKLSGLYLDGLTSVDVDAVIACVQGCTSFTSLGLPVPPIPENLLQNQEGEDTAAIEVVNADRLRIFNAGVTVAANLVRLRFRNGFLPEVFFNEIVELLAGAPQLLSVDLYSAKGPGSVNYTAMASLEHPSLMSVVLTNGQFLLYSGSKQVKLTITKHLAGFKTSFTGRLRASECGLMDFRRLLQADEMYEENWGISVVNLADDSIFQVATYVATASTREYGSAELPAIASSLHGERPEVTIVAGEYRVGGNLPLCSVQRQGLLTKIRIGNDTTSIQFGSIGSAGMYKLNSAGNVKHMAAVQGRGFAMEIQDVFIPPRRCITATSLAVSLTSVVNVK